MTTARSSRQEWLQRIRDHVISHLIANILYAILVLVVITLAYRFRAVILGSERQGELENTLAKVQRTRRLSVGYIEYLDMSHLDPQTGKVVGLLPDILVEIVKEMGLTRADIDFHPTTWRDFALGLNTGKYDLSIAGTFVTRERQCAVAFTNKLFCLGNGLLVRKGDRRFRIPADLNNRRVTVSVVQGEQGDEYARILLQEANLTRHAGPHLTVVCNEVASGHADAALSDQYVLSYCATHDPRLEDILQKDPYYVLPIAWAVRKQDTEWRIWLNTRINQLRHSNWLKNRLVFWGIPIASEDVCITPDAGLCSGRPWHAYIRMFSTGIAYTLIVSGGAILLGTVIGALLGSINAGMRRGFFRLVRVGTKAYVYIFLAIPVLVLIIALHYTGRLSPGGAVATAIVALGLNLSPFAAKIIAGGIHAIPKSQLLAARAAGYDGLQILKQFKLPLVIRNSWHALFVEYVTTLKLSSLASVIGVTEALFQTQQFIQETYRTEIAYVILMLSYLVPVVPISLLLDLIEERRRQREDR